MADSILGNYFSIDPQSTIWGVGQNALVAALPAFQTPGRGYEQNFGSALGLSLLSALMGYQARRSAAQQSLEAAGLGQQLLGMQTPEERLGFIKGVDNSMVQERLLGLNTKLAEQELANKLAREQKVNELTTAAEFELGDLGTKLFEREIAKEVAKQEVLTAALQQRTANRMAALPPQSEKPQKDFWEKIPAAQKQAFTGTAGQVEQLRSLAEKFRTLGSNAIELNAQRQIPGSDADLALSAMQTLVPSTVKMLGDTGALSAYDQEAVKKATLGNRLSGSQSIAARLDQLADLAETKTATALEAYKTASEQGGAALLSQIKGNASPAKQSGNPMQVAAEDFLANLKAKYGTEWAIKATDAERQTAKALREAAGK